MSGPADRPAAPALLLRNAAHAWVGPAGARTLVHDTDVLLEGGTVASIGRGLEGGDARVVDATGWLVLPGLVNAHHHLSQQLLRAAAPSAGVVGWLAAHYPTWARLDAEAAGWGARVGLAELVLSGVTTVADLTYFYPRGHADIFDAQVQAARDIGCRLLAVRGGLADVGEAVRAIAGDEVERAIEPAEVLLAEVERAVTTYHDPAPDALVKVGAGLTEPLWDRPGTMRALAALAASYDVRLHTHLHPRPADRTAAGGDVVDALRELGWWHDRTWVAHGTALDVREIDAMAADGVGLATCPSSNARLATPIAPAWELHRAGGIVAVGVDGAASNDGGHLVAEARLAWQVQRIRASADPAEIALITPEVVLDWATVGGARALGWDGLGVLEPGGPGDLACFDLRALEYAGTDDPLAALLLCGTGRRASFVTVAGRPVVEDGRLAGHDEDDLAAAARHQAARLL
ncbi:MAG: amidohydrolase family protein [Nocardioidaceae bacterium]|nr:amidohydrolase family protein [Nocardioidaceae bacterium]